MITLKEHLESKGQYLAKAEDIDKIRTPDQLFNIVCHNLGLPPVHMLEKFPPLRRNRKCRV